MLLIILLNLSVMKVLFDCRSELLEPPGSTFDVVYVLCKAEKHLRSSEHANALAKIRADIKHLVLISPEFALILSAY
jgi:hypothetical protein